MPSASLHQVGLIFHEYRRKYRLFAWKQDLLLLLDLVNNLNVNLQHIRDSIGWGQSEPLSQRDIGDTVALVQLNPDKLLCLGGVLNVMAWKERQHHLVEPHHAQFTYRCCQGRQQYLQQ